MNQSKMEYQVHKYKWPADNWRPSSLSKLIPIILNMGLTNLGSGTSNPDSVEEFMLDL